MVNMTNLIDIYKIISVYDMKKFFELLATPIGGILSAPLITLVYALYALMFHVGYTELVRPIAELYGYIPPTVPFWQWIAVITIISMFKYAFAPSRPNDPEKKELIWKNILTRIAGVFTTMFIALLINWIWL